MPAAIGSRGHRRRPSQISIDTSKASVARAALEAGATLVNDVTALRGDPEMAGVVAQSGAECCLMHMLGEPRTMQRAGLATRTWSTRSRRSSRSAWRSPWGRGSPRSECCSTPGSASARRSSTTSSCCAACDELAALGRPLVVGTSRKSFLGRILAEPRSDRCCRATDRLPGTIATCVLAYERGASVLRVHDVAPVRAALAVAAATLGAP